ncbi:MAG TPA: DNA translocase FtsK 4TM domain-containing protein [Acidimicrobiales bacterium]|nr:DNA translocase FtsK 4TM domain-containing protein [Acidimicrobiales bacterium]
MTATRARPKKSAPPRKKAPARRRPGGTSAARKRKPSRWAQLRTVLATHLGRQSDDVWGLLLILAGVLAGLGIYADATGPIGRLLEDGTGAVFGWGRVLVPLTLVGLGAVLVRGAPRTEPGRIVIGCLFLVLSLCGLLHLLLGAPVWGSSLEELRGAGGFLGVVIAEPLRGLIAVWGASLVLTTLLALSVLILTRTSVRAAADVLADGARAIGQVLGQAWSRLATLGRSGEIGDAAERHPSSNPPPAKTSRSKPVAQMPLDTDADSGDGAEADEPAAEETGPEPATIDLTGPAASPTTGQQLSIDLGPATTPSVWRLPPLPLLKKAATAEIDRRSIDAAGRTLEESLAAHGVDTRVVGATTGPTVTRYELELGPGVKVAKVTSLHKDIAYAMAAADVRILAPIPGRSAIGIEVPNVKRQLVDLGGILASEEARRAAHPLEVGVGRDIAWRPVLENLASMPHLLIAGATGAGKSSCINSLITSVLMRATPDQVRMILIDPKRVELGQYNGVPHLLTPVVVNPKKAANALQWAVHEMERRYDLLAEVGVRDIGGYNAAFDRGELTPEPGSDTEYHRLPFILLVVDELTDLMMVAARDVEESICRIAQMARAVGIHLVIATQRPSVDVITGVIKANIPSRLAFAVSSLADSRVILDQPGAERLIGKGDMLLLTASSSVARRIQGPWVSEDEVRKVVAHWRRQGQAQFVEGVEGAEPGGGSSVLGADAADGDDDMLGQAMELIVRSQLGSTSMLQRKLQVGFARAGRIMDQLETKGVVGPSTGSKAREVLMTVDELEARLGGGNPGGVSV